MVWNLTKPEIKEPDLFFVEFIDIDGPCKEWYLHLLCQKDENFYLILNTPPSLEHVFKKPTFLFFDKNKRMWGYTADKKEPFSPSFSYDRLFIRPDNEKVIYA